MASRVGRMQMLISNRLHCEANQRSHATPNRTAEKGSENPRMRAARRRINGTWVRAARGTNRTENRSCAAADDDADEHGMAAARRCWRQRVGLGAGRGAL